MVDIRNKVEDSRGALKKIQLLVPGFSGYRKLEDIRAADNYLRIEIATKIHDTINELQDLRKSLTDRGFYSSLSQFQVLFSELQQLEGAIRHAQQGYSGISPPIRIGAENLDKLYEYDYQFVQGAINIKNSIDSFKSLVFSTSQEEIYSNIQNLLTAIRDYKSKFNDRMLIVQNIKI